MSIFDNEKLVEMDNFERILKVCKQFKHAKT